MRIANKPASESAPGTHRPVERPLYEPPRLRSEDEGERPTSWLEFFFDLVFVVAIDQVARRLQHGVTGHTTLVYLALYAPIWWAWVGFVIFTDRFGTDDISDRFMSLLQIGAPLVIAASAMHATSDHAVAFATAYGVFRLILAARYAMAAHYVREARPECTRQSIGFGVAGLLWLVSAALPAWRFWMWGAGFAVDLLTPFASPRLHRIVPPDPDHIEERFGTFINIGLGEGFVGRRAQDSNDCGGAPHWRRRYRPVGDRRCGSARRCRRRTGRLEHLGPRTCRRRRRRRSRAGPHVPGTAGCVGWLSLLE